jgi:hypothetical protein
LWWGLGAALLVAFAALVVVHGRLARARERAAAALGYWKRAAERLEGKWPSFAGNGARYLDDAHPYALDLDVFGSGSLFQLLNETRTRSGERMLASWLAQPAKAGVIRARQQAVAELAARHELREALAVAGARASEKEPDPEPLLAWAEGAPGLCAGVALRAFAWLLPAAFVAVAAAPGVPSWASLGPFALGLAALAALRGRLEPAISATTRRSEDLARFAELVGLAERAAFESEPLRALVAALRGSGAPASDEIARLARLVSFLEARHNGAFRAVLGPILMWDLHWVAALERWQRRAGPHARRWLDALGELEALASLATFSFENPGYALPDLDERAPSFEAEGLGHPLLASSTRVVNDVSLPGPGLALLVTGSNMSGKSTLLRSVGLGAVLALAGAPVCARSLRLGVCEVRSAMRVSDSVRDGVSRFYAELVKIKGVVGTARAGRPVLFLLDEILHGTNSRERHIGARSVVRALLDCGATGAVSTHDLALADLEQSLGGRVRNVHFEEQVAGGRMTFDYTLRDGVVRSGNALRWMRAVGLEVEGIGEDPGPNPRD